MNPTKPQRIVISCGGTGGHLAPGIALAQELRSRGHECLLLVSRKAVDTTLSSKYPELRFEAAPGGAFSLHPVRFFKFLGSLLSSVRFFGRVLKREQPVAAVAFGGFTTGGLALAAALARVPLVLHEANHVPGKAIRAFRPFAAKVFAPPGSSWTGAYTPLGFPLRAEFTARPRDAARASLGLPSHGHLLVVLGGSQGARALNAWAAESAPKLAAAGWHVICLTGAGSAAEATASHPGPDGLPRLFRTVPFCHTMPELLSASDLALARSGAGTVAELRVCHVPAFLVPYPHAADNHQQANAAAAVNEGWAYSLPQENLDRLLDLILGTAPGSLRHGTWLNALRLSTDNARVQLADEVLALSPAPPGPSGFPLAALL